MKNFISTIATLFIIWLICMAIWNNVISDILSLRHVTYWEMALIYSFIHFLINKVNNERMD